MRCDACDFFEKENEDTRFRDVRPSVCNCERSSGTVAKQQSTFSENKKIPAMAIVFTKNNFRNLNNFRKKFPKV